MKKNKTILYLREFDFTKLSYYKSRKYKIERKIYKYIGVTDESLINRTSKWTYLNLRRENKIGDFLKSIMKMEGLITNKQLNKYIMSNTKQLKIYDDRQRAEIVERSLISINRWEEVNKNTVCMNSRDEEVKISSEGKYMIK